jgi:diacylglycerol kinase family enzyme
VEYIKADAGQTVSERAVCAMAVRVGSLGGVFAGITRRAASSEDPDLRLVLVRPPALISLPVWLVAGWLRLERINPLARFVTVREFSCLPLNGSPAHVEADGEWLGKLPMRVSVVPDALRILRRDLNAR